jgi:hypothetical protein
VARIRFDSKARLARARGAQVSLAGVLGGPIEDGLAEDVAQLRALAAVQALADLGDQPVLLAGKADVGVDDLLALLGAEGFVMDGQIRILEAAPAADVQHQDPVELIAAMHPLHHRVKAGPPLLSIVQ